MEVSIGVLHVARDISFETDASAEEVSAAVGSAIATPDGLLSLTDTRGRRILVPGRSLGWVQIGETEKGRVGFGLT